MTIVDTLRWTFVTPAALFGWVIALNAGITFEGFLFSLCPQDKVISDTCTALWYSRLSPNLFPVYTALAAVLVIVLPMLVAPNHRFKVGIVFYALGSVAAVAMSLEVGAAAESISALVTGLMTLFVWRQISTWPSKGSRSVEVSSS